MGHAHCRDVNTHAHIHNPRYTVTYNAYMKGGSPTEDQKEKLSLKTSRQ